MVRREGSDTPCLAEPGMGLLTPPQSHTQELGDSRKIRIKYYLYSNKKSSQKIMINTLYNLLEVLIVVVPMLLAVAFMTIIERKQLAAMQRRVGPNTVGYYGVLQPFAD